jgi:predicted O-methyltransferase YrrM
MSRSLAKRAGFHLHGFLSRLGLHLLPKHYYSPVADIPSLERSTATWAHPSAMPGIPWNLEEQAAALREICAPYREEYTDPVFMKEYRGNRLGPGYGPIESLALYAAVRHYAPARIIEVGSGASTFHMLEAARKNASEGRPQARLTCIEPHPSAALGSEAGIVLVRSEVQRVAVDQFRTLEDGDLLFIDSTHTVKPGSDVNFLILEVLPRLRPGVIVHFHDIYFPFDYQRDVLRSFLHWSESSLLRAFLINNPHVQTLFCMSALHYDAPDVLREVFPSYVRREDVNGLELPGTRPFTIPAGHFPSSLYLRIT